MNNVKNVFSIKDLENLSGIKAHTIRIWEKRYEVLQPMRTETNIRLYDLKSLQKLLNIALLHNHGYKISKISKLPPEKIPVLVKEIISEKSVKVHAINDFKMAMMNFDQNLFLTTYDSLLSQKTFREIFFEIFMPLLNEIGLLWQTNTITPAHEHFISYLIKLKLLTNTEKIHHQEPTKKGRVFVLFLPINEIHELGLMYLNYEFLHNGYKTIFLGENVPIESLKDTLKYFDNVTFVSYFTVKPEKEQINSYITQIEKEILTNSNNEFWVTGKMIDQIDTKLLGNKIKIFNAITDVIYLI